MQLLCVFVSVPRFVCPQNIQLAPQLQLDFSCSYYYKLYFALDGGTFSVSFFVGQIIPFNL